MNLADYANMGEMKVLDMDRPAFKLSSTSVVIPGSGSKADSNALDERK